MLVVFTNSVSVDASYEAILTVPSLGERTDDEELQALRPKIPLIAIPHGG